MYLRIKEKDETRHHGGADQIFLGEASSTHGGRVEKKRGRERDAREREWEIASDFITTQTKRHELGLSAEEVMG